MPLSNEETDQQWSNLIKKYRPNVVIFGLQTIDERKLTIWRNLMPHDNLKFVRKGTSLHRVDFAAAKKNAIEVLNTPSVNSLFVAKFITDIVLHQNLSTIGIIDVGDIGKKVALTLLESQKSLMLYNRTHHSLPNGSFIYCENLNELFKSSHAIVIRLPLNNETSGIITAQHIQLIPKNSIFICISPPRVISTEAIIALDQREDIKVIFDHVASGLAHIHESLQRNSLRNNFIFDEKAAADYECQYATGERTN